jgi:hypothetical protein
MKWLLTIRKDRARRDVQPVPNEPKPEPEFVQDGHVIVFTNQQTGATNQKRIVVDSQDSASYRKWIKGWTKIDTIYPNMKIKK